jgi:hypothetical protein
MLFAIAGLSGITISSKLNRTIADLAGSAAIKAVYPAEAYNTGVLTGKTGQDDVNFCTGQYFNY